MMADLPKIKRYFTQADYEAGLCDKNGLPIAGGPAEPPKKSVNNASINDEPEKPQPDGETIIDESPLPDIEGEESDIPGASAAR